MAAPAPAQQVPGAVRLVPVHDEPGAVQFQYRTAFSALGGADDAVLGGGGQAPLAALPPPPAAPLNLPPALEGVDEFISFDVEPAAAAAAAVQVCVCA